jgi:phage baseplate assembly protein W
LGSNPYHSFYGSNAMSLIGQKVSAGVAISLRTSVQTALDTLIDVQTQQSKVQEMSLEERVKRVRSIEVSTIGNDETSYLVRVSVESLSMQVVGVNVLFTVPGAITMDGELR